MRNPVKLPESDGHIAILAVDEGRLGRGKKGFLPAFR